MRTTLADPVEFPELPLGRLHARTIQRVTTATAIHHRSGPWARCSEEFSRVVQVGTELRAAAALAAPEPESDAVVPVTLHRRSEPAFA